jgi:hypothetical protein
LWRIVAAQGRRRRRRRRGRKREEKKTNKGVAVEKAKLRAPLLGIQALF